MFRRSANTVSKLSLAGLLILVGGLIFAAILVGRSSYVTRAHEYIEQPVQSSHRHHVKDDGIDCRYCQGPLNYALLAEPNTRPRTTYLAIVRNPNTELEPPGSRTVGGEGH